MAAPILLPVAVGISTAALTAFWIACARRWRVQDLPGQRRLHSTPTPRGGGIAIALAWGGALWLLAGAQPAGAPGVLLPLGFALLVGTGLIDDFAPGLHPLGKLTLQTCGALAIASALLGGNGEWWPRLLATGAGVALLNTWNFMDGSNGMIALQSLLIALALATWPAQDATVASAALALAAACLGFLPFNFPRARVFLGDVGSLALGGAVLILLGWSMRVGTLAWVPALLLCSPMLLDAGLTLARRILRGRPFWRAHREHLYQYAVRKGHSHTTVALAYALATVLAWALARLVQGNQSGLLLVAVPSLAWVFGAALYLGLRRRWLGKPMRTGSHG